MPTAIEESKIQGENRTGKGQLAPQAFPSIQWDLGWSGFIFHSPPFDQNSLIPLLNITPMFKI